MATNQQALKDMKHQRGHGLRLGSTFIAPLDGRSHVSGDRSEPLLHQTIPALFSATARAYGPRDAAVFVEQDKRFTWDELAETVDAFAAGLLSLGLKKGDRIGIWSPNRWEWLVTQFATARIGLILVNINPAYRLIELEYALNKVGCRALISAAALQIFGLPRDDRDAGARARDRRARQARSGEAAAASTSSSAWATIHRPACSTSTTCWRWAAATSTSGSTDLGSAEARRCRSTSSSPRAPPGAPKGATLTHDNIVNNAHFVTGSDAASPPTTGSASRCRSIIASAW